MNQDDPSARIDAVLARLTRAAARLEALDLEGPGRAYDALAERHERLRGRAAVALAALDELLARESAAQAAG